MLEKIGIVKCSRCNREWTAACESDETNSVECPGCGFMQPLKSKNGYFKITDGHDHIRSCTVTRNFEKE